MHDAVADRREELAALCRRYDVICLEVFGSAARGEDFDPATSDTDFLVEFGPDSSLRRYHLYFDFATALRDVLGRPVALHEIRAVTNPNLRTAIDRSRELVHAS